MITGLKRLKQRTFGGMFRGWLPPADETVSTFHPLPWDLDGDGGLAPQFWRKLAGLAGGGWLANAGCGGSGRSGGDVEVLTIERRGGSAGAFRRLTVRTTAAGHDGGRLLLVHEVSGSGGVPVGRVVSRVPAASGAAVETFPPIRYARAA